MTSARYVRFTVALGLVAPLVASAASVEERLQQLEQAVSALTKENASLKKQLGVDASGKPAAAQVVPQGKETKLAIGGFIQANAEFGGTPDTRFPANDRFILRRARLGVKGAFAEQFDFVLQADVGANTLASTSGYRAQTTDCYVNWSRYPLANVTIGQFKTPFGFEQLIADPKNPMVERSLASDQLTLSRQVGAMLSGTIVKDRFSYSAGLFNGNGANNAGNDNDQFLYVGRVSGTVVKTDNGFVALGLDGFTTRDAGAFTGRRRGGGVDAQVGYGPAQITGEYLESRFDRDVGADTTASGWSILGSYMLIPNTLQGLVRYETFDPNHSAPIDDSSTWSLGFNYYIRGDDLKLSVNYLFGDPAGVRGETQRLLTRMQVVF
jgi:phosphate-selective porin